MFDVFYARSLYMFDSLASLCMETGFECPFGCKFADHCTEFISIIIIFNWLLLICLLLLNREITNNFSSCKVRKILTRQYQLISYQTSDPKSRPVVSYAQCMNKYIDSELPETT